MPLAMEPDHALCIHLLALLAAAQIQGIQTLLLVDPVSHLGEVADGLHQLDPVSYTHLDVYKRQVPTIPEAIIERAKHPAYGYFQPTDEYLSLIHI